MRAIVSALRYVRAFFTSKAWARRAGVVLVPAGLVLAGSVGPASATPPDTDLTGGAGDTFFTSITNYFKDHVISSVLLLLALTVGVSMLMGWGKKGAKSK